MDLCFPADSPEKKRMDGARSVACRSRTKSRSPSTGSGQAFDSMRSLRMTDLFAGSVMRSVCGGGYVDAAGQPAADHRGNLLDLVHHAGKLVGIDRLRAVGESLLRMVVDLDKDTVAAGGHSRAGHGQHAVALAGAVAGVDKNGQVTDALHRGDDAEVKGVAGVVGKGAHAPLAENHLIVALAHNVLGGHQELFERG